MENKIIERLRQIPNKEKIFEIIEKEKAAVEQLERNLEQISEENKEAHIKYIEIRKNGVKRVEEEMQKNMMSTSKIPSDY